MWIFYLVDQVWESESMYYKKNNKDLLSKKDLGSRRILIKINNMVVKKKETIILLSFIIYKDSDTPTFFLFDSYVLVCKKRCTILIKRLSVYMNKIF